jgi:hypothetical protein
MCDSATKLAVKVCGNGQWQQDINAMEDNNGGEWDPTYMDQRTNRRVVVALFSSFENDAETMQSNINRNSVVIQFSMYIGSRYQQKLIKEFNTGNFSMYIGIQYLKNIDIGIQDQKSNRLRFYLFHHFTEFLQHKM